MSLGLFKVVVKDNKGRNQETAVYGRNVTGAMALAETMFPGRVVTVPSRISDDTSTDSSGK